MDCYASGLSVQGIQDEELTAALQEALASTEVGRAARDEARAAAEKHHGDGEGHYTSRDYPASISCFEAALSLDTQSETLRSKLTQILKIAEAAHEAAELGPTGAPMSLPLLHAHSKIGRWRKGMDAESEDVYATLEEHERKLTKSSRSWRRYASERSRSSSLAQAAMWDGGKKLLQKLHSCDLPTCPDFLTGLTDRSSRSIS